MERIRTEEEHEDEELFPFLLKDWRDSCLVIASITEAGTFTGKIKYKLSCKGFSEGKETCWKQAYVQK